MFIYGTVNMQQVDEQQETRTIAIFAVGLVLAIMGFATSAVALRIQLAIRRDSAFRSFARL